MANSYSGVATAGEVVALPHAIREVFSNDILYEAVGIMKFWEFAVKKTELGRDAGQTVTFTKYANISRGGVLTESSDMETKNLSTSQFGITVNEYGNAVGVREKLLQVSWHDVLAQAAKQLGRDYAIVLDLLLRDTVLGATTNVLYAGDKATRALMDGDADFFDVELVRDAVELLQTANAPKFNGDYYIGFIHPHQAAYLSRDPDWIAANNYANTRRLFNGELGRWNDVIFIVTTHMNNGAVGSSDPAYEAALVNAATGGATNANVYKASIFGDNAFGFAEGLPVELRDNGVQDFGRKHALAWYSIMGSGRIDEEFIVNLETV
jgi:N4-gp56 family major capsid protein